MTRSLYDELGGEDKLRQIIDTFIDRVFADRMIGFFFRHADKGRIAIPSLRENGSGGPGKIYES